MIENQKRLRKENFKCSMVGIEVGEQLLFKPTNTLVTVNSENTVSYQGEIYSFTAFTKKFLPSAQQTRDKCQYRGTDYFYYKGKSLVQLRAEKEAAEGTQRLYDDDAPATISSSQSNLNLFAPNSTSNATVGEDEASFYSKKKFNQWETALLIDSYLQTSNGQTPRKSAIAHLSLRLRHAAISHNAVIDEKFRNTNGINFQLRGIEYYLTNGKEGLDRPCQMFKEIAHLYYTDPEGFQKLLTEANEMYPEPSLQEMELLLMVNEPFAGKHPYNTQPRNNIATLTDQPSSSMTDEIEPDETEYETREERREEWESRQKALCEILKDDFPKGFRFGPIDMKRLRDCGEKKNPPLVLDGVSDETLWRDLCTNCIVVEEKDKNKKMAYAPDSLIVENTFLKIRDFALDCFEKEKCNCIYYSALFDKFSEELSCQKSLITSVNMLKTCLKHVFGNTLSFKDDYFSFFPNVRVDLDEEVVNYVLEQGVAVTIEKAVKDLFYLPAEQVRKSFNKPKNNDTLILNTFGERFHIDNFAINEAETEAIAEQIEKDIAESGRSSLWKLVETDYDKIPAIVSVKKKNEWAKTMGLCNVLIYKLSHRFSFSKKDKFALPLDSGEQNSPLFSTLLDFCGERGAGFTYSEIEEKTKEMGVSPQIYLEKLAPYCIRVNDETFKPLASVCFDVEGTDKAIATYYCQGDYLPIGSITDFSFLPCFAENEYIWNSRLLESYLLTRSEHFAFVHNGPLNKKTVCGAIVKRGTPYDEDFFAVVCHAVATSGVELDKENVLNFLAEKSYIRQTSYKEIDNLLIKSKELRNKLKREE